MPTTRLCDVSTARRPRVLLLAYACSPYRGSEPGVGWNRAVQTARHYDTWVLCEEHEFAADIRRYLDANGPIDGLHFCFVPLLSHEQRLRHLPVIGYQMLRHWHQRAFRVACDLHRRLQFDLVHQVNVCGFREPGYLWKLDVPFVWGPFGGSQNSPWLFLSQMGFRAAVSEAIRRMLNGVQLRFSPRVRAATRKAAVMLAANSTNQRDFARVHGREPILLLETGVKVVSAEPRRHREYPEGLRLLWTSRLEGIKGLPLLLDALARLPADVKYHLRILGKGPMERAWRRRAERLGIAQNLTWMGHLPFDEAIRQYDWAHVFLFTSLRDTSGTVVVEALAGGLPVVTLDHHGVHDIVTDECGIKIPVTTPREVTARIGEALVQLSRDVPLWERLSRGALDRARDFLWSRQQEQMNLVYEQVLGRSGGVASGSGPDDHFARGLHERFGGK